MQVSSNHQAKFFQENPQTVGERKKQSNGNGTVKFSVFNVDCGVGRLAPYQEVKKVEGENRFQKGSIILEQGQIEKRLPLMTTVGEQIGSNKDIVLLPELRITYPGKSGEPINVLDPMMDSVKKGMGERYSSQYVTPYNNHGYKGTGPDLRLYYGVTVSKHGEAMLGGKATSKEIHYVDSDNHSNDAAPIGREEDASFRFGEKFSRCGLHLQFGINHIILSQFSPTNQRAKEGAAHILRAEIERIKQDNPESIVLLVGDENRFSDMPDTVHEMLVKAGSEDWTSKMVEKKNRQTCASTFQPRSNDFCGFREFKSLKNLLSDESLSQANSVEARKAILCKAAKVATTLSLLVGLENQKLEAAKSIGSYENDERLNNQATQLVDKHQSIDGIMGFLGVDEATANRLMARNGYPGADKPLDNVRLFGNKQAFELVDDRIDVDFRNQKGQKGLGNSPLDNHRRLLEAINEDQIASLSDHAELSFTLARKNGQDSNPADIEMSSSGS